MLSIMEDHLSEPDAPRGAVERSELRELRTSADDVQQFHGFIVKTGQECRGCSKNLCCDAWL